MKNLDKNKETDTKGLSASESSLVENPGSYLSAAICCGKRKTGAV
jgi:hypothetical protein